MEEEGKGGREESDRLMLTALDAFTHTVISTKHQDACRNVWLWLAACVYLCCLPLSPPLIFTPTNRATFTHDHMHKDAPTCTHRTGTHVLRAHLNSAHTWICSHTHSAHSVIHAAFPGHARLPLPPPPLAAFCPQIR